MLPYPCQRASKVLVQDANKNLYKPMLDTITKLGEIATRVMDYQDLEIDVYEAAFVAKMYGGAEELMRALCFSEYYYRNGGNLYILDTTNTFAIVSEIFKRVAEEIISERDYYRESHKDAFIKISDDEKKEVQLLKEKMLYDYKGDTKAVQEIVNHYTRLYFQGTESHTSIEVKWGEYKCKSYILVIVW